VALARFLRERMAPEENAYLGLQNDLDDLETRLTAVTGLAAPGREAIATRLRGLLTSWGEADDPDTDFSGDIDSASTSEIFDFIDNQLGRAAH